MMYILELHLPPSCSRAFCRFAAAAGADENTAFEKILHWFYSSEEYLAPPYACYLEDDRVMHRLDLSPKAFRDLEYLVSIGKESLRSIAYTAIVVFLAQSALRRCGAFK